MANHYTLIGLPFIQTEDLSKSDDVKELEEKMEGDREKETKGSRQEDEGTCYLQSNCFTFSSPYF